MPARQRVEQRAGLDLRGPVDFDPDDVTALLGLEPTAISRGERPKVRVATRRTSWRWYTQMRIDYDSEATVVQVLDQFEPVAPQLAEAVDRWQLRIRLALVVVMFGEVVAGPTARPKRSSQRRRSNLAPRLSGE